MLLPLFNVITILLEYGKEFQSRLNSAHAFWDSFSLSYFKALSMEECYYNTHAYQKKLPGKRSVV